jgi:hypothetical protein
VLKKTADTTVIEKKGNQLQKAWQHLSKKQKITLGVLSFIVFVLPLSLFIIKKQTNLFPKASYPITPPITSPTPSPAPLADRCEPCSNSTSNLDLGLKCREGLTCKVEMSETCHGELCTAVIGSSGKCVNPGESISACDSIKCVEECPGADGVLRNCNPPESDGTSQNSLCGSAFKDRMEVCGDVMYCCDGNEWTTNIKSCSPSKPSPTPSPSIPPGCYYQQVTCFQAPCDPILVCPSPSPTPEYLAAALVRSPKEENIDNPIYLDLIFNSLGEKITKASLHLTVSGPLDTTYFGTSSLLDRIYPFEVTSEEHTFVKPDNDNSNHAVLNYQVTFTAKDGQTYNKGSEAMPLIRLGLKATQEGTVSAYLNSAGSQISYADYPNLSNFTNYTPANDPEITQVVKIHLLGDLNNDGLVDISDYSILVLQLMQTGVNLRADLNNDGIVDISDYSLLISNISL